MLPALSQTVSRHVASGNGSNGGSRARSTGAKPVAATPTPARARAAPETISVSVGRTVSHGAVRSMGRAVMDQFVQGSSPMMMLSRTPGINFVSDDPLGVDTWGSSLYMRGFEQNQLGVTLDGVPLGAQDYYTYNGQTINFAILSDNIERMDVSEGGGDVAVPSTTNLGGSINIYSSDPKDKFGGKVAQMFGSHDAFRTYVRVDSGRLNASGTKFMVAYARSDGNKWKGPGEQFDQQVNFKLVQPIGQESSLKVFFNWNDATQFNYADQSLSMIRQLGYRNDYLYPNYAQAYAAAQGHFTGALANFSDAEDVSYYDGITHASDYLGGLNLNLVLTKHLEWDSVVYGQAENHWGTWTTPYTSSPNGSPLSEQVDIAGNQKYGFTSTFKYRIRHHTIEAGVWYENNQYSINQYLYSEPVLGQGAPINAASGNFGTPFQENWGETFNTNTFQFHLEDRYRVLPNLTLQAGFRSLLVTTTGGATANDAEYNGQTDLPRGSLTSAKAFLPHINATWRFLPGHELYFDITRNMKAYGYGGYQLGSPWGVSNQTTFDQLKKTIQPETAWVYNVGYRYNSELITGSLSAYHADFSNRLQSLTGGTIIQPVSTVVNVGSVSMYGVDALLTIRPIKHLSFTNSISYNHSTYGNNITSQGVTYALQGKKVVAYPQFMYKANLTYDFRGAQFHIDANYMSKRYFSYMNDESVPGYWMTSLGARYNFGDYGPVKNLTINFNIYNLANVHYISQIGENGLPLTGDDQSALVGAPRQYFGTISASF
ncbi:TonB-dependent receptor [Komagataeibacter sp. FNDCF1]|uniref:TonB-dependent receptor n=1 Tax=Komagataeibacter sp. FNDCF1 TaxID=2878681 RepID=UPI001E2B0C36|nr:TonB-dependent receptor [Komagataeibacter sp. FNDCF1]MCE2565127.1 TonB-dependent receptor [Komagataeibacter sp. FNDCF1]